MKPPKSKYNNMVPMKPPKKMGMKGTKKKAMC